MPINIHRLSEDEIASEFKRVGNSEESLAEYVETLQGLDVGSGFTVRVTEATDAKGKLVEVVPDSGDGENVDTVRAFKRRMKAAGNTMGLVLKWKPKGHRTGDGENARYVTDWLVVKVSASKPEKVAVVANGQANPV